MEGGAGKGGGGVFNAQSTEQVISGCSDGSWGVGGLQS